MFNSRIIKLVCNVIFLFITGINQDMFIVFFIYICTFELYYLYVCTFMAISNTSLMLLSIDYIVKSVHSERSSYVRFYKQNKFPLILAHVNLLYTQ